MKIKIRLLLAIGLMCGVSARVVRAASYSGNKPPGGPGSIGTDVITNNTGNTWGTFAQTFGSAGKYVGGGGVCTCMAINSFNNIVLVGTNTGATKMRVEFVSSAGTFIGASLLIDQPSGDAYPIANTTLTNIYPEAVAIGSDNRIYIGGQIVADFGGSTYRYGYVCCLTTSGALDVTFGVGGYKIFAFEGTGQVPTGQENKISALRLLADGRVMVAGYCATAGLQDFYAVGLLDINGVVLSTLKLSAHIAVGGTVDVVRSIGVQKLMVAGQGVTRYVLGGLTQVGGIGYMCCAGFLLSEDTFSLDTSFGAGTDAAGSSIKGSTMIKPTLLGGAVDESCWSMVINPLNNTITLAGYSTDVSGVGRFAVVQLTENGSLNTNFVGNNNRPGTAVVANSIAGTGGLGDSINAITVDNQGNLITVGYSLDNAANNFFALAAFTQTGILNTSFATAGTFLIGIPISGGGTLDFATSVLIDSDNILVGGASNNKFALVKLVGNIVASPSINGSSPTSKPITTALSPAQAAAAIQTAQIHGNFFSTLNLGRGLYNIDRNVYGDFIDNFIENLQDSGLVTTESIKLAARTAYLQLPDLISSHQFAEVDALDVLSGEYTAKELREFYDDVNLNNAVYYLINYPTLYGCALYVAGFVESLSAQNITGL